MRLRLLFLFVALGLLIAACGDDAETSDAESESADETPTSTTAAALPEIADVGVGPYDIGVQTITITDPERDRALTVDVWFPLADGTDGDLADYSFVTGDSFPAHRALAVGADAASPDGPFPMVVYSHGSGGQRYIHADYTEAIAGHGYVVVAPDHNGNTAVERVLGTPDPSDQIAYNRPLDVQVVIDAMTATDDPETADFAPLVDPESIAVTGHSFGGYTAYAVASGTDNNPNGTTDADPRVDAIVPLAPAVGDGSDDALLTDEALARIEIPTLIIVGTEDSTTPVDPNVETAWAQSSASPHYRVELVDAEHQSFTDICDYLAALPDDTTEIVVETLETMGEAGCSPGDMPIDRVQELTNTFAVSFLESVFRDGEMITAETATIPDDVLFDAK